MSEACSLSNPCLLQINVAYPSKNVQVISQTCKKHKVKKRFKVRYFPKTGAKEITDLSLK